MSLIDEGLVKRIRDAVLRAASSPVRVQEPIEEAEENTLSSIRLLARSRVSYLMRQLRAAHGLSYAQIQAQTGFPQQMLFDFEYKDRRLTLDELRTLAGCYGIGLNDVLGVDIE